MLGLGRIEIIHNITSSQGVDAGPLPEEEPEYLALDGSALENLEVSLALLLLYVFNPSFCRGSPFMFASYDKSELACLPFSL